MSSAKCQLFYSISSVLSHLPVFSNFQKHWDVYLKVARLAFTLRFLNEICSGKCKGRLQLNALQRLKGSLDQDSCMAKYTSFVMSNFNYCPLIWMFTSETSLYKLENIQKRALRFVLHLMNTNRVILICYIMLTYPELKWWSCDISQSKFLNVWKSIIKEITGGPVCLNAMFIRKECPYALRDSSILIRPKVNLTHYGL